MLIVTGALMSIVIWPWASVTSVPTPGTVTCTPGSGTLASALKASLPLRVQLSSVTVVGIGASALVAGASSVACAAAPLQAAEPHSCLSLRNCSTAPVVAST